LRRIQRSIYEEARDGNVPGHGNILRRGLIPIMTAAGIVQPVLEERAVAKRDDERQTNCGSEIHRPAHVAAFLRVLAMEDTAYLLLLVALVAIAVTILFLWPRSLRCGRRSSLPCCGISNAVTEDRLVTSGSSSTTPVCATLLHDD
jgi:hypothetical protein